MTLPQARDFLNNGDEVVIGIALPPGHEAFRGHFPGQPILAGVLQVDWATRFAAQYFKLDQIVAQDFQVKFQRVIRPDEDLSLMLRLDRLRLNITFEYQIAGKIASSGKIKLKPCR